MTIYALTAMPTSAGTWAQAVRDPSAFVIATYEVSGTVTPLVRQQMARIEDLFDYGAATVDGFMCFWMMLGLEAEDPGGVTTQRVNDFYAWKDARRSLD